MTTTWSENRIASVASEDKSQRHGCLFAVKLTVDWGQLNFQGIPGNCTRLPLMFRTPWRLGRNRAVAPSRWGENSFQLILSYRIVYFCLSRHQGQNLRGTVCHLLSCCLICFQREAENEAASGIWGMLKWINPQSDPLSPEGWHTGGHLSRAHGAISFLLLLGSLSAHKSVGSMLLLLFMSDVSISCRWLLHAITTLSRLKPHILLLWFWRIQVQNQF